MNAVDSPWFGVNFDSGNIAPTRDPYAKLASIAPYAVNAQIKIEIPADGQKQPADMARIAEILKETGYRGYITLEYEGEEEPRIAIPGHFETLRKAIARPVEIPGCKDCGNLLYFPIMNFNSLRKIAQSKRYTITLALVCMAIHAVAVEDLSIEQLEQKAGAGDTAAMVAMGERYATGDGVEQNIREALRLFREAANAGEPLADFSIGLMYLQGFGVDQNIREGLALLEKAAAKGVVDAQNELGLIYVNEDGVAFDYQKAVKYFTMAAEEGDPTAQNNLGWIYLQGLGVEKDFLSAEKWFTMAAEQGSMLAQANLGSMFAEELDIQDRVKAHMWLSIAAANGNKATGNKAWIMEVMMSKAGVEEAKRLAEEWLAKYPTEQ